MKHIFMTAVNLLLFPFLYCRRTILEASEICWTYDPVGYMDSDRIRTAEASHLAPCRTPRRAHCSR